MKKFLFVTLLASLTGAVAYKRQARNEIARNVELDALASRTHI